MGVNPTQKLLEEMKAAYPRRLRGSGPTYHAAREQLEKFISDLPPAQRQRANTQGLQGHEKPVKRPVRTSMRKSGGFAESRRTRKIF